MTRMIALIKKLVNLPPNRFNGFTSVELCSVPKFDVFRLSAEKRSLKMPRALIDLLLEVGVQRGSALIASKRAEPTTTTNSVGCWLFGGSCNTDGYGQIYVKKNSQLHQTGRSAQTAVLIHKVSWMAVNGQNCPVGYHISHLCDNRSCFNPDHLCAELPAVNNSRKGCPGEITCSVHHHVIVNLCTHSPLCIRSERDDIYCCLTMKESSPGWDTQGTEGLTQQPLSTPLRSVENTDRASTEYEGRSSLEGLVRDGIL